MTELYRYMTPSWLNTAPSLDRLTNTLTRDIDSGSLATSAEQRDFEVPQRPPLYPFSPM